MDQSPNDYSCPWCKGEIDQTDLQCPHCGKPTVICGECADGKCPTCLKFQQEWRKELTEKGLI